MIFSDDLAYVANRKKLTSNGSMRVQPTVTVASISPENLEDEITSAQRRALECVSQGLVVFEEHWIVRQRIARRPEDTYDWLLSEGYIEILEERVLLTDFGEDVLKHSRKSSNV